MKRLLIVYHTMTGAAQQLATAAHAQARDEIGCTTELMMAAAADAADVLAADGYLFVTPENLATMAGRMKDFFDRVYYGVLDKVSGRPYATIIAAGTDGEGAARQIQRIATGLRLREIAPPLVVRNGAQTPEQILAPKIVPEVDLSRARELGAALAAGLAGGVF
ncbi:MAG TPA: NAD(P)H-dependent oxidoreductase [Burkholderiaceae bacterium]|nr:NAD(P)H-dependent oxidoreductase [Burkholderiaceae bacterium]